MKMKTLALLALAGITFSVSTNVMADNSKLYADFPITVKGYEGDKKTSVAYTGQVARHVLHTSLKKMISKSTGEGKSAYKAQLYSYFSGKDKGREIVSPVAKDGFAIKQTNIDEISKGKNLAGKSYKGLVAGWPGNKTGKEVLAFMLDKSVSAEKGYDAFTGYDYKQLFSKTAMGAVFYNQAVDNYLDEKITAGVKPNDKPYKKGAPYTGKEHAWDEGFGYFGAPANALTIDAKTAYNIAKGKKAVFKSADANNDGKIDLKSEMTFGHAYYAADSDKSGKTNYLNDITAAFLGGRQLIQSAKGEKLSAGQLVKLNEFANTIKVNWEKVIAEAAYKYAGSVYKDLKVLTTSDDDIKKSYRKYAKHWGELKGFALALQMGGKDLGETAVKLNRLIGFSPVNLTGEQVVGLDADGKYITGKTQSMGAYMINMAKVQTLLREEFALKALKNTVADNINVLSNKLREKESAEND